MFHTLPREIVTIDNQESSNITPTLCLSCAEKQYANGAIVNLSSIQSHVKHNKVLALLNRTFSTLYELNDSPIESKERLEQKKEAIKEGVNVCLDLLQPIVNRQNIVLNGNTQISPIQKNMKKKNWNVLDENSSEEKENKNQPIVPSPILNADGSTARRRTARGLGSAATKRSKKQEDEADTVESPPKRTKMEEETPSGSKIKAKKSKKVEHLDVPLPVISPAIAKKTKPITPARKKSTENNEKVVQSVRFARKVVHNTVEVLAPPTDTSKIKPKKKKKEITPAASAEVSDEDEKKVQQEKPAFAPKKPAAILPHKSSIDTRNDKGESLVHQAVKKGDITRVKQLMEDGHSANTIDHNSWTPLHEAGSMGNIPLMEVLLRHNANINVQGGTERMTVLHEAIANENPNEFLIKFLLEFGADPHLKNKEGKTAIDLATSNTKLRSLLETTKCLVSIHNDSPLAPPPRRRMRTTSSSNVIFFTGFDKARKDSLIKAVQSAFGRKTVSTAKNVENNVTHVVACGETSQIAFRTINYLRGIVLGKWMVSDQWIEECIKQKQWIGENEFEIVGSQIEPNSNGSHKSRVKHEQNESLLFDKCDFFLHGQFHTYKKEDLTDLIKITGATLLKREPKLHRIDSESDDSQHPKTYIVYETSIPDMLLDNNRIKHIQLLEFLACVDYYDTQGRL